MRQRRRTGPGPQPDAPNTDGHLLPTEAELASLADPATLKRARRYVESGAVVITARSADAIEASVSGTDDYAVHLLPGERLDESHCSCPAFAMGRFCKHLVATALVARNASTDDDADGPLRAEPSRAGAAESDLRAFLLQQPVERLAGWLMDLAATDSRVEQRLEAYRALQSPAELRRVLGRLLRAPRFLDWQASRRFAPTVELVTGLLRDAAATQPEAATELYEYALKRLLTVYGRADDSGGHIGDAIRELAGEYLGHLRRHAPAGAKRAAAILALQREDDWEFLPVAAVWPCLDARGQSAYSNAVEAEFRAVPPRTATGGQRLRGDHWGAVLRMEALAMARGDTDLLISVVASDLSGGHAYERLVEICEKAGRDREATQWAERGLAAYPDWPGMRALVARQFQRAGLTDEALALLWAEFEHRPDVDSWRQLKRAAGPQWPEYRTRALDAAHRRERTFPDGRRDGSLRVRLLLADQDIEAARQLALDHPIQAAVMEQLAGRVAPTDPASAAAFLRRVVDATLPHSQPRDYAHVAQQVAQVLRLAPGPESRAWLNQLRTEHRARRKLMALLDAATGD